MAVTNNLAISGMRENMQGRNLLDHWMVSTLILLLLISTVVGLWLWLPDRLSAHLPDIKDKGVFGDSYGAITALFTGLGFAGLVFTILLQQREIKLQRDDFFTQMDEMKRTRDEVSKQSQIQERQICITITQLKIQALEAQIEYIKMDSLKWGEWARSGNSGPQLLEVKQKMEELIDELERAPR